MTLFVSVSINELQFKMHSHSTVFVLLSPAGLSEFASDNGDIRIIFKQVYTV